MMLFTAVCFGIWQEKAAVLDDGNHPPISMLAAVDPHQNPAGSLLKSASHVESSALKVRLTFCPLLQLTRLLPGCLCLGQSAALPLGTGTAAVAALVYH
jgi:hypothetical protein